MRGLRPVAMIRYSKYHGCGNDFVILAATDVFAYENSYPDLARQICHRQLGVGADGLIIVKQAPLEMIIYNSDGSRAPMCGNGIRCFAKYCFDEGICIAEEYPVETLAGIMGVRVVGIKPFLVEVSMGKPDFDPKRCGIKTEENSFLKQKLRLADGEVEVSCCFMGTIHTVLWLDQTADASGRQTTGAGTEILGGIDLEQLDNPALEKLGEEISSHPFFTEKTNVNFVRVVDRGTLRLRTYERGAGMTFACGTGACASVVVGALEGKCDKKAQVMLPYGQLGIVQKPDDEVMMTGPAVRTAQGCFEE